MKHRFAKVNKKQQLKGALCSFGEEILIQNFNIYTVIEVIIQIETNKTIYIITMAD